jgi:hypothetical protein
MTESNVPSKSISIEERLRIHATAACERELDVTGVLCLRAADEIKRLRAEFQKIVDGPPCPYGYGGGEWVTELAERALQAETGNQHE